jgi:hypothetical protein
VKLAKASDDKNVYLVANIKNDNKICLKSCKIALVPPLLNLSKK